VKERELPNNGKMALGRFLRTPLVTGHVCV